MRFMISFNDGDMQIPDDEWEEVGNAAHAVMREAMASGVWMVGAGFMGFHPEVVGVDGTVTNGSLAKSPVPIGGFCVIDVKTKGEAYVWAHKIAIACRCPQEIREIMEDPEQEELQNN